MQSSTPGRPRTARTERTKQKILEVAARLLAEKGYGATSLDDVATAAGVSKGTIYYNFTSKEEIYWGVVFPRVEASLRLIERAHEQRMTPREGITFLVQQAVRRAQDPSQRYMYFQEMLPLNDEMRQTLRKIERMYEQGLADLIQAGQEAGEITPGDPGLMALIAIGTIARTARWYDPDGSVSPADFERTMLNLLLGGLFVDYEPEPTPANERAG